MLFSLKISYKDETKKNTMKKFNFYKTSLFVATFAFSSLLFAQDENLVENGGFETVSGKPKKLGAITTANGWQKPTGVAADLFIPAVKVADISTPDNVYGMEEPYEGRNYAGIVAYSYNDKVPRTYLRTKLVQPLKKGAEYCVTFYVSLAETSKYATNAIGANLNKKQYETAAKASIIDEMHIKHTDDALLNGQYGWDKICGIYTAKGGEKFLTIGNFLNNNQVKYDKMRKPKYFRGNQIAAAYYYVDDVSVKLVDSKSQCDCSSENEEDSYSKLVYQKVTNITDKMKENEKIEAHTLYFAYSKYNLTSAAKASLDEIAKILKATSLKLEIYGHMDDNEVKKAEENPTFQDLGESRAEEVKDYLIEKGVHQSRILLVEDKSNFVPSEEVTEIDNDELKDAKTRRVTFIAK